MILVSLRSLCSPAARCLKIVALFFILCPQKYASSIEVSAETVVTTSKDVLEALTTDDHPQHVLVALGYCAWERQQLDNEILDNAWLTVPATSDIIFHLPASERWSAAAAKLGINIHMIASEAGHS